MAVRALPVEVGAQELAGWAATLAPPVALTGATGFVGSHVAEALVRAGVACRVAVRDRARLVPVVAAAADIVGCDLCDAASLEPLVAGCGTVLHVAGVVRAASEAAFMRANAAGTEAIVRACRVAAPGCRLVCVSSLAAAGPSEAPAGRGPEEAPHPISAYGRSKLAGEAAARAHDGPWVIVRPPAVYGPRDVDVLQFFRLAARGVVPLPSGERWVTLAHVSDVVRAVLAAAAGAATGRVLHAGEPVARPMEDVIAVIARAGGVRARCLPVPASLVRLAGAAGDGLHRLGFDRVALTSDKARELLARHWTARTDESLAALGLDGAVALEEGARSTWAWYRRERWLF